MLPAQRDRVMALRVPQARKEIQAQQELPVQGVEQQVLQDLPVQPVRWALMAQQARPGPREHRDKMAALPAQPV